MFSPICVCVCTLLKPTHDPIHLSKPSTNFTFSKDISQIEPYCWIFPSFGISFMRFFLKLAFYNANDLVLELSAINLIKTECAWKATPPDYRNFKLLN